jgi:hypothetical protein
VNEARSYASPAAFRTGLTARLKNEARTSQWTLAQLQRQFGYDRLLARLYHVDRQWIVKGATALLAREIGVRGTRDIDVYRERDREVAEAEIREAAALDIDDWFRFELGPSRVSGDGATGVRIPVKAYVGATPWAEFHIDLVGADYRMIGQPENVPPIARIQMPDVEQLDYVAYPLTDHVADKVAATFDVYGSQSRPSTRYRDLVDLVAIATRSSVPADELITAVHSEAERREVELPNSFDVPDRELWTSGYAAEAEDSLLTVADTLDEALDIVRPFIDPILSRTARGIWDPNLMQWRAEDGS